MTPPKIDACAILAAAKLDELMGQPMKHNANSDINTHNSDVTMSGCNYSTKNQDLKSIGLLIKYDSTEYMNPKTLNGKAKEIKGIGDMAEYFTTPFQLIVFWKNHYEIIVSLSNAGDKEQALKIAKSVAQQAMKKL